MEPKQRKPGLIIIAGNDDDDDDDDDDENVVPIWRSARWLYSQEHTQGWKQFATVDIGPLAQC